MLSEPKETGKIVKELEKVHKVVAFKLHGHEYQRAGLPDFVILTQGLTIWVEAKAAGEELKPLQVHTAALFRKQGAYVFKLEYRSQREWIIDDLYSVKFVLFADGVKRLLDILVAICKGEIKRDD